MAGEMGVTEVAATRQALVASIVQETLKQESKLLPTVADFSRFAVPGSKSVAVPRRDQFAAADKTENTDLTAQVLTFSADTISLEKHKAVYAKLEDIAQISANVDVNAEIIKEMSSELALQVDKDIIVELKLASAAAPDHILDYVDTVGDVLALADIANARKLLNVQNVPMGDRFMGISPLKEQELLAIDNFISAEKYASREALLEGEIGRIFGFSVIMHTELGAADSLFWHRNAVGYASQMAPSFETDRELKATSTEYLLQLLYGVEVLDSGLRQVYYSGA